MGVGQHKTVLKITGFEDKDISKMMQFPATKRELLDKLQVEVIVFEDRVKVKAVFPVKPIVNQLCTSLCRITKAGHMEMGHSRIEHLGNLLYLSDLGWKTPLNPRMTAYI